MKPVCKSFSELSHDDKNNCIYNLFLICSSIFLLVTSFISIMKFINKHCYRKYSYKYNTCDCGCQNNDYEYRSDNCECE